MLWIYKAKHKSPCFIFKNPQYAINVPCENMPIFCTKSISICCFYHLTLIALMAALVMRIIFAREIGGFISINEKS